MCTGDTRRACAPTLDRAHTEPPRYIPTCDQDREKPMILSALSFKVKHLSRRTKTRRPGQVWLDVEQMDYFTHFKERA